jgi:hypothetical protein
MAVSNPKLEFYRFTLKHKDKKEKTFRDFAIEELNGNANMSNDDIFVLCFNHFVKQFTEGHALSKKKQKTITLIADPDKNPYIEHKPTFNKTKNTLSGVINGGFYDKEAIVSNITNNTENATLEKDKAVLFPYFIFAYFPADHFEGMFIVHSYSKEDSIKDIFRGYVTNVFSGNNYHKAIAKDFCPKSFQEEYRKDAVIKNLIFSTTVIDNQLSNDPIQTAFNKYKVEIKITPISKKGDSRLPITIVTRILDKIKRHGYKKGTESIEVENFETKKLTAENEKTKKPKTFEWNSIDNDFVPVVLLKDKINVSDSGMPNFNELKTYCSNLFNNEILKEIRPDLDVTNI